MKRQLILGVTLLVYFVTGSACFAATYSSTGYGLEEPKYFVSYEEARDYTQNSLEAIAAAHNTNKSESEAAWAVYELNPTGPDGDLVQSLEMRIKEKDTNILVYDPDGHLYSMTASWYSSADPGCPDEEYQMVFVEPVFEAPFISGEDDEGNTVYQCTATVYDGDEVLETKQAAGYSAEMAEWLAGRELVNKRYLKGCTIIQVDFDQYTDVKGDAYDTNPFAGAVPGVDLDGVQVGLGGHYYYKTSPLVLHPDVVENPGVDAPWDMSFGWKNDFDIRVGKVGGGKGTIIVKMRGRDYFFYQQKDDEETYVSRHTGDDRLQVLNNGTLLRIRMGDTAFEFDMPEEIFTEIPLAECTKFDFKTDAGTKCQAGFRPVTKTTRIVTEAVTDGIYSYNGFTLEYSYNDKGLLSRIEEFAGAAEPPEAAQSTGEYYTFQYYENGLLENVKNTAGEVLFTFTYDPANYNLLTRKQKGDGDENDVTTFHYYDQNNVNFRHLLAGIDRPGGVTTKYIIKTAAFYEDEFKATNFFVDYRPDQTEFSGPQVIDDYQISANDDHYTAYFRPLRDDAAPTLEMEHYAASVEYYPERFYDENYGYVIKRESIDERYAVTTSYAGEEGRILWSQVHGTTVDGNMTSDGTVRTTRNEWDDNGNLKKTVTRDLEDNLIPAGTWDVEYMYDEYNRVTEVKGLDGVTRIINYVPNSVSASMIASQWTVKGDEVINKTAYEYYPGEAPVHQRFRLHKKQLLDGDTVIAEEVFDYVADNAYPQNIGKLWTVTYYGGSSADGALEDSHETYSYNQNGLESHTNRNGGTEWYVRDDLGRVTTHTSASNAVTGFTYYPHGRLWTKTLPSGGVITYSYDAQKRLEKIEYPDADQDDPEPVNSTESITYRVGNLVETTTSRMGLVSTYDYYDNTPDTVIIDGIIIDLNEGYNDGSLKSVTTTDGALSLITYDGLGRVKTSTDARGLTLTFGYDAYGRHYKTTNPDDGTFTRKTYDDTKYGRPLQAFQDRMGAVTTFEYDDFGRQTARVLANDLREETGYDSLSRLIKRTVKGNVKDEAKELVTDYAPVDHPLTFEGMPTRIVYPDQAFESFEYENGLLRFKTDRAGRQWEYTYTSAGQPDRVIAPDGLGDVSDIDYIPAGQANAGRVEKIISADGVTRTFEYDQMGRLSKTFMPDENDNLVQISQIRYCPAGPDYIKDRGGIVTERQYDPYGRLYFETEPGKPERKTYYTYYLAGDLHTIKDANNNVTTMSYDDEGRLKKKEYYDGSEYSYLYYPNYEYEGENALAVLQTDPKQLKTRTIYNQLGQLVKVEYLADHDQDISYNYNVFGALDDMTDASGTTSWAYDGYMRLTSEDGPFADNDLLGYAYNAPGKRLSDLTLNSSSLVNYTGYDPLGRIREVNEFTFSYINQSSLLDKIYRESDKVVVDNEYDTFGRLKSVTNTLTNGTTVNSYGYILDDSDRRDRVTFKDESYIAYDQDDAGRLESAKGYLSDGTPVPEYDYNFEYDAVGNPLLRKENGFKDSYRFNELNQPDPALCKTFVDVYGKVSPMVVQPKVTVNDVAATVDQDGAWNAVNVPVIGNDGIYVLAKDNYYRTVDKYIPLNFAPRLSNFVHDDNGNMTTDGLYNYTWNDANRLASVEPVTLVKGDRKLDFVYDGFGRRRVKTVSTWSGNSWTLSDIQRFVYNGFKQVAELDSDNAVRRQYAWLGGRLMSVSQDGATYYPTIDGNNNITAYINAADESLVARYTYSPFGSLVGTSGDKANDFTFRFSSEAYDSETGHIYYNYRYYNPAFGRWLNRDPIGEAGGINLYAMAGNNLVDNVDRLGLSWQSDVKALTGTLLMGLGREVLGFNLAENVGTEGIGLWNDFFIVPAGMALSGYGAHLFSEGLLESYYEAIEPVGPIFLPGHDLDQKFDPSPPPSIPEKNEPTIEIYPAPVEQGPFVETFGDTTPNPPTILIYPPLPDELRKLIHLPMAAKVHKWGCNELPHYTIETEVNGNILHTHSFPYQIITGGSPMKHDIYPEGYEKKLGDYLVEVPDEFLAQEFQRKISGTPRGIFSIKDNNCLTEVFHCLRHGGFEVKDDLTFEEGQLYLDYLKRGKQIPSWLKGQ